jgi:hypothetical protein
MEVAWDAFCDEWYCMGMMKVLVCWGSAKVLGSVSSCVTLPSDLRPFVLVPTPVVYMEFRGINTPA